MDLFANQQAGALAASERVRTARRLFVEEGTLPSGLLPDAVLRS